MTSPSSPAPTALVLSQTPPAPPSPAAVPSLWMISTGVLAIALVGVGIYGKLQWDKLQKQLRLEAFRTRELKKRLDTAMTVVKKLETNPDLVHSREFNLDYLRMRMEEETFHFSILNQIKMKIKMLVSLALRPTQKTAGAVQQGNAGNNRKVDHTFDVEYDTNDGGKRKKRVLFRIQISLMKLPTQPTSKTIEEIIKCLEHYLSSDDMEDRWQPTLQGRIATIRWDQKAKPTPLLVMNQSQEGMNVTMRSRMKDVTAAKRVVPEKKAGKGQAAPRGKTVTSATQSKGQTQARTSTQSKTQARTSTQGKTQTRSSTQAKKQSRSSTQGKSGQTQVRRIR